MVNDGDREHQSCKHGPGCAAPSRRDGDARQNRADAGNADRDASKAPDRVKRLLRFLVGSAVTAQVGRGR